MATAFRFEAIYPFFLEGAHSRAFVIASAAKQSFFLCWARWIASLRS